MKHLRKILALCVTVLSLLFAMPVATQAQTQMRNVKHVFIILMENHNWTGNNSAASSGDPDIKGSSEAPYINSLIPLRAHAEQYFNPPGNHPSAPDYIWLEGGTNFGILDDNLPASHGLTSTQHLATQLTNAGITWKFYVESYDGSPNFTNCPLDGSLVDINHVGAAYFSDTTNGFSTSSHICIAHVRNYSQLATDLASGTACTPALINAGTACYPQYSFLSPNTCHQGHEGNQCVTGGPDNTRVADDWLKNTGVPTVTNSAVYNQDGALFILWDEAEDGGAFSDGPIGMFVLSPFAKVNYQNTIHYDHSSMLKTFDEIFGVPLLRGAANPATKDLSDFFLP